MGIRTKQTTEQQPKPLLRALCSWVTTDPDGLPTVIHEDELVATDGWIAERFGGWLCPADLPDAEVRVLKTAVDNPQ